MTSPSSPPSRDPVHGPGRRVLRFAEYELDPRTCRLSHRGQRVPIQAQPFKLLSLLVTSALDRPGEVVTHEEIRDHLWGERHVDFEQGIHQAVRQIRRALEEDADEPRVLETVVGRGYRCMAPVGYVGARLDPQLDRSRPTRARREVGLSRALLMAFLVLLGVVLTTMALPTHRQPPRVRVLPFAPERSLDASELGARLTDEVVTGLGKAPYGALLPVVARAGPSAALETGTAEGLHRQLEPSPDFLVQGRIRESEGGLRVTARLVHVESHTQIWSSTYVRKGEADLPELGRSIAQAVKLQFTGARARARYPEREIPDPEVARLLDQARTQIRKHLHVYNRKSDREVREARALLERALEIDASWPAVHLELARIYHWRWGLRPASTPAVSQARGGAACGQPPNEGAARRHLHAALVLDQQLVQGWLLSGMQALFWDLDVETAEMAVAWALELDSTLSSVHYLRGTLATVTGRPDDATASLLQAVVLDPEDAELHLAVGRQLFMLGRFAETRQVFRNIDALLDARGQEDVECLDCLHVLIWTELLDSGEGADGSGGAGTRSLQARRKAALVHARRELDRMRSVGREPPALDAPTAEENLRRYWSYRLDKLPPDRFFVERAALHLALGERHQAVASLRRVPLHREDQARIYLRWDPRFEPLRNDPTLAPVWSEVMEAIFEPGKTPGAVTGSGVRTAHAVFTLSFDRLDRFDRYGVVGGFGPHL